MPVKRKPSPQTQDLEVLGRSFIETDDTAKLFGSKASELKKRIMSTLEQQGDPDENGHVWGEPFAEPILSRTTASNGKVREETVVALKRQKSKSRYVDAEKVEAWAKKHKIWDEVTEEVTIRSVVEDALWKLVFDGRFTEEEINDLYGENVTFSLVRVTE